MLRRIVLTATTALLTSLALVATAHATAGTPPTGFADRAGLVADGSGYPTVPHVAIVWPASTGALVVDVVADDDATPLDASDDATWTIDFFGTAPATVAAPCVLTPQGGGGEIVCTVSQTDLVSGLELWTGNGKDQVSVAAGQMSIAPLIAFLRGTPSDYQTFTGGPGADYVNLAAENTGAGLSILKGRGGIDTFIGSPNSFDRVSYDDGRSNGVHASLDGVANDGNAVDDGAATELIGSSIEAIEGSSDDDTLIGDAGNNMLFGGPGDDVIDGRAGSDQINGGAGSDIITGGAGSDTIYGDEILPAMSDGDDDILIRDGEHDTLQSCGGGNDTVTMDAESTDPTTAGQSDCEHKDRAAETGGSGGTTGGGTTGGGTGIVGGGTDSTDLLADVPGTLTNVFELQQASDTKKSIRMPQYVGKDVKAAEVALTATGINMDLRLVPVPITKFPKAARASTKPGEILTTTPAAKATITTRFPTPTQRITIEYYDPKLPKDAACPYTGKIKTASFTIDVFAALQLMSVRDASALLDDYGCNWTYAPKPVYTRSVTDARMFAFKPSVKGGKKLLTVTMGEPMQPDFRAVLTQPIQPGYDTEIGLMADDNLDDGVRRTHGGSVVATAQRHYLGLTVMERATGRVAAYLPVALLDATGTEIAKGVTDAGGSTYLQFLTRQSTGVLRLVMEKEDGAGNVLMSGIQEIPVYAHGSKDWVDLNGNVMRRKRGTKKDVFEYERTGVVVQPKQPKQRKDGVRGARATATQSELYSVYASIFSDMSKRMDVPGCGWCTAVSLAYQGVADAFRNAAYQTTEQAAKATGFTTGVLGNSIAPLSVTGEEAFGLRSPVLLIGTDGASLKTATNAGIVAAGAGNIVAAGAGNLVGAGAGNLVGAGAGNIVAAGAGNIVAAGAGNLVGAGAGNIVAAGSLNAKPGARTSQWHLFTALVPEFAAAGGNISNAYVADMRSNSTKVIGDTTVIALPNGSVPAGTLVATGRGETPIVLPGKLR